MLTRPAWGPCSREAESLPNVVFPFARKYHRTMLSQIPAPQGTGDQKKPTRFRWFLALPEIHLQRSSASHRFLGPKLPWDRSLCILRIFSKRLFSKSPGNPTQPGSALYKYYIYILTTGGSRRTLQRRLAAKWNRQDRHEKSRLLERQRKIFTRNELI